MSKMGMVCGIADVHRSKLEFSLDVSINSSFFPENQSVSLLMRKDHLGLYLAKPNTVLWL